MSEYNFLPPKLRVVQKLRKVPLEKLIAIEILIDEHTPSINVIKIKKNEKQ